MIGLILIGLGVVAPEPSGFYVCSKGKGGGHCSAGDHCGSGKDRSDLTDRWWTFSGRWKRRGGHGLPLKTSSSRPEIPAGRFRLIKRERFSGADRIQNRGRGLFGLRHLVRNQVGRFSRF